MIIVIEAHVQFAARPKDSMEPLLGTYYLM